MSTPPTNPSSAPPVASPTSTGTPTATHCQWPAERSRRVSAAMWVAMRGTGVLLSVLVLGHLLFVHLLTDVSRTGAGFVARRWSSALWLTWDGTMLTAALLHGAIGMSTVIRDYVRRPAARRLCLAASTGLCCSLGGLGWYAIAATVFSNGR